MQLDDRSNNFINELVRNPNIKSKDLERKYKLSRRQIDYSFEKINYWLKTNNFPIITRTRQGAFIVDPVIVQTLMPNSKDETMFTKVMNEEDRVRTILLMVISSFEELSIVHFTSELDVSKNTVLNDLKRAKDIVSKYDLIIHYSRREGYLLQGKEFDIRRLLLGLVQAMLVMSHGKELIENIANIKQTELDGIHKRIETIENDLGLKFTDEKIEMLPYVFSIILKRINKGLLIKQASINYKQLSDTKEYRATEKMLSEVQSIPEEERLYMTLHILSTNVYWSEQMTTDVMPELEAALEEMLLLFEKSSCILIQNKAQLLDKLLLHVKPAYYRIKYHLTEVMEVENPISEELKELHHLVKKSTSPLSQFIGVKVPDSETVYLSMLIGGWLTKQGEKIQTKIKAIVVCPKGVSVSRLMFGELRELFPEFIFLDSLSIRAFNKYTLDYDIVFSPVYLETDKKLYIANSYLEQEEKFRLRKQVMIDFHGIAAQGFKIRDMKEIISKHTTIHNEELLIKDLYNYINEINDVSVETSEPIPSYTLRELISTRNISLIDHVDSWDEAVRVAAEPLLNQQHITRDYVKAMLENSSGDPYIIIGKGLAIPHASPEDGVNQTAMSLLRIKEGVKFSEDYTIHVIVVIAASDKDKHIKALMQLMKLSGNKKDMQKLTAATDSETVERIIEKYSKKEEIEK